MNFTLDDDSPDLIYSASGWGIQSASNPDLESYFQRTYHVAEADGATVNFTFTGSALAIYGSTGPGHADFDVQFDDDVIELSAFAAETQFQQLLFQRFFSSPANASSHFISLKAKYTSVGTWLDVDFLTFTDGAISWTATTSAAVATVTPPYISGSSSLVTSPSASPSPSSSASASSSSKTPVIIAALFGAIIVLALLAFLIYALLRRFYEHGRARERQFRHGQPTGGGTLSSSFGNSAAAPARSTASPDVRDHSHGVLASLLNSSTLSLVSASAPTSQIAFAPPSPTAARAGSPSVVTGVHAPTPASPMRSLFSQPVFFQKSHKGDADSLRTDFLQV
ncbi:uncharacterized protein LAESUDRAFT_365987 [Laetiporus sulphureus 93-53]|uniref:Uncharacterized protein n=1 Tax=Laetiporus sulphureus 93-53 TaxID=1314785 RepID=A0A165CSI5_9APHY|nr:uncharacterized protein LAESUDRAFT_365987 [Laetiporus sulphureus 93-53]KZT03361.1 hypothetical protein LAESUDRAFT_365987 [Laetiporus sulphureus 93-53]